MDSGLSQVVLDGEHIRDGSKHFLRVALPSRRAPHMRAMRPGVIERRGPPLTIVWQAVHHGLEQPTQGTAVKLNERRPKLERCRLGTLSTG